LKNNFIY